MFPLKRYVVVAWDQYYPNSDLNNIRASFDDDVEATNYAKGLTSYDWVKVYDFVTGKVIYAE